MRKLSESSIKEKDTMKKHCEKEKSQMSSIMQSYKTESDNIVERKDKEIESLKQKMKKENDKSKNEVLRKIRLKAIYDWLSYEFSHLKVDVIFYFYFLKVS